MITEQKQSHHQHKELPSKQATDFKEICNELEKLDNLIEAKLPKTSRYRSMIKTALDTARVWAREDLLWQD